MKDVIHLLGSGAFFLAFDFAPNLREVQEVLTSAFKTRAVSRAQCNCFIQKKQFGIAFAHNGALETIEFGPVFSFHS